MVRLYTVIFFFSSTREEELKWELGCDAADGSVRQRFGKPKKKREKLFSSIIKSQLLPLPYTTATARFER